MTLKWYTSYLAEPTQTFQVETDKSKTSAVDCSVPQGSLKVIAYTDDLPPVIEEHNVDPYLYTDDGQLDDHILLFAILKMENFVAAVHRWSSTKSI